MSRQHAMILAAAIVAAAIIIGTGTMSVAIVLAGYGY